MLLAKNAPAAGQFEISPLTNPTIEDFTGIFTAAALSLGRQTHDLFWTTFNPGYETDDGIPAGAEMLRQRYTNNFMSVNESGVHNGFYAIATVPCPENQNFPSGREIIGAARFLQLSLDPKYGLAPTLTEESARKAIRAEESAPGDPARQNYLTKLYLGSSVLRSQILHEKMEAYERGELKVPAVLALDLCAVKPAWQGRGVGKALVQFGLQEASKRGNLESITEGSIMGRRVYAKCGYKEVKESIIDLDNGEVIRPGVVIMRTDPK